MSKRSGSDRFPVAGSNCQDLVGIHVEFLRAPLLKYVCAANDRSGMLLYIVPCLNISEKTDSILDRSISI